MGLLKRRYPLKDAETRKLANCIQKLKKGEKAEDPISGREHFWGAPQSHNRQNTWWLLDHYIISLRAFQPFFDGDDYKRRMGLLGICDLKEGAKWLVGYSTRHVAIFGLLLGLSLVASASTL